MKDIKNIFRNVEKRLRASRWFEDEWEIYNRGNCLQLAKSNWCNGNQGGVHFETYIEAPQIKKKAFPVCMHAEEDCPSQARFIDDFLQLEQERIRSWKGYQVVGDGFSICQRELPLNFKNLEDRLLEELNRLRQLESSVDKVLESLTP